MCIYMFLYFLVLFFPKGHLHWVSASEAVAATVRVYSVLFEPEDPEGEAAKLGADAAGEEEEGEVEEEAPSVGGGAPTWLKLLNPKSCR